VRLSVLNTILAQYPQTITITPVFGNGEPHKERLIRVDNSRGPFRLHIVRDGHLLPYSFVEEGGYWRRIFPDPMGETLALSPKEPPYVVTGINIECITT
jgi:hypothetical protein